MWGLLVVVGLLAATAFFVAAEFAFVAARRSRLEQLAAQGARGAAAAVEAKRQLALVLSAVQLGITVVSLLLGSVAEGTLGGLFEPLARAVGLSPGTVAWVSVACAFTVATALQMVLGELVPKNLAIAAPESCARVLALATLGWARATAPLTKVLDRAASLVVRLLGGEVAGHGAHDVVSVEELDRIVAESAERGELTGTQAELLSRGLEFDELRAGEVMVPWNRTARIWGRQSCEGLRGVLTSGHTRFPVVGPQGVVLGVVHAKDLLGVDHDRWGDVQVADVAREALVVPESCRARSVLAAMRERSTELAVVADEFGAPAGIVTLEDLLEELVGDIDDEFDDDAAAEALVRDDGSVVVPGHWRIDEVERATGVELPEGEAYTTVAGLVLDAAQSMVQPGDRVQVEGFDLEVVGVDGWSVTEVAVQPRDDQDAGADGEAHDGEAPEGGPADGGAAGGDR